LQNIGIVAAGVIQVDKFIVFQTVKARVQGIHNRLCGNDVNGSRFSVTMRLVDQRPQFFDCVRRPPIIGDVGAPARTHHLDKVCALFHHPAHGLATFFGPVCFFATKIEVSTGHGDASPTGVYCGKAPKETSTDAVFEIKGNAAAGAGVAHGRNSGFQKMQITIAYSAQEHK
jgi:hypothetical protein